MNCGCLFVLAGAPRAQAQAAVRRLDAWFEALEWESEWRWLPETAALVGSCGPSGHGRSDLLGWGEPPPGALASAAALLDADDRSLRSLDRATALLAVGAGGRVRLVTGATGPQAVYRAGSPQDATAWATSAVAAALLTRPGREIALEPAHLPQVFAFGGVGGRATHLRGVAAVDSATVVDLRPGRPPSARSYWPSIERWARVPEPEAERAADEALLASLDGRLSSAGRVHLGLTGGLDSGVVAVALAELGLDPVAMTWGTPGHPDVDGAARLARRLGLAHEILGGGWHPAPPAPEDLESEARWHEGLTAPPLLGRPGWPAGLRTFVTGAAGETGRAFYHRLLAGLYAEPRPEQIAAVWRPEDALGAGAAGRARAAVRDAKLTFLGDAAAAGQAGWRLLDVVYAEQRFRRWGRGILPRGPERVVAAFSSPALQRALVSLPLEARISDGWHRRFIARGAGDLVPPAPPLPRAGVPRPLRRLAARLRARGSPPGGRHPYAEAFAARPELSRWVAEEALATPALAGAMGEEWTADVRGGFEAGLAQETEHALAAAGLATLEAALRRAGARLD